MNAAYAAEAAGQVAGHGAFYENPTFWVAIAFVILAVAVFKPVMRIVGTGLDERAERIREQIDEAQRLREEAQELLADYQKKQREANEEAARIVKHAKEEAKRFAERAKTDLEHSLKRREQLAMDRIAQAEAQALAEVRAQITDVALDATRKLVVDAVSGKKGDALIDAAIKELPEKFH